MALTWNGGNGADADACPDRVDLETMFAGLATKSGRHQMNERFHNLEGPELRGPEKYNC